MIMSNPGGSVHWPEARDSHSSVLINSSTGLHLLVLGGVGTSDCWLFDTNEKLWKQLVGIITNHRGSIFHGVKIL